MTSWHSYPKIYNFGHAALHDFLSDTIIIEEKIDGSQFSFGRFGDELKVRSKGVEFSSDKPESMFQLAVDTAKALKDKLPDGYTFRGEFLSKSKHNTLAYDRVPTGYIVIFDINPSEESYLNSQHKKEMCDSLGLECVRCFYEGPAIEVNETLIRNLLEQTSMLGGQKIEGVVLKNYKVFGPDKKVLMAKHVSEAFKEVHAGDWRSRNPTKHDMVELLTLKYRTPARWAKAVQHLKERGELKNSPQDIGNLIREASDDLHIENSEEIKQSLYGYFMPKIMRGSTCGLAEWYKDELLKRQFNE